MRSADIRRGKQRDKSTPDGFLLTGQSEIEGHARSRRPKLIAMLELVAREPCWASAKNKAE